MGKYAHSFWVKIILKKMAKILIVEDDSMLIEIYQKKFSDDGYEVVTATTGAEVLKKIKNENPELVLLDLVLPEEDGFHVLEKIKKDSHTKNIKVIIFSNLSQQEDQSRAAKLGAEGFLTKSDYTPTEMVEEVQKVLKSDNQKKNKTSKETTAKSDGFVKKMKEL